MSLDPNKLNKFSTFNNIWFLDVATPQEQISGAYKNKRGRIIRSSGIADTAGAALQTLDERNLKVKGEYFIDNVMIDAVVSPNQYSGLAFATNIEFEVTEPYSIGLFLQTLQLAALEAGFVNYINASFVLGVEFIGYDSNGVTSSIEKRVLLIKLMKVEFSVSASGSVYRVEAIAWNHQALLDQASKIPVNISLKGDTVEEILTSLAQEGITETIINTRPDGLGADVAEISGTRSLIKAINDHESDEIDKKSGSQNVTPTEYEILFPIDPSRPGTKNNFALQKIAENFTSMSNQDMTLLDTAYDDFNALYERRKIELSENGRVYQFKKGTKIEKIIEEVILTSEWVQGIAERKPDSNGYIEWFKILTFVQTIGDINSRDRFGSRPKKYIFMVYPYKVHASRLSPPSESINYNTCVRNAVKGYNYTYTGENIDIIDFNIEIDYAWLQAIQNLAETDRQNRDPGSAILLQERTSALINQGVDRGLAQAVASNEIIADQGGTTNKHSNHGGLDRDDPQTSVAKAFNDAIVNSNSDLIQLKMSIWGDPYYLPDSDYGGHIASSARFNQDSDGTMDHIRGEVDVLINFAGAVDYKNSLLLPNTAREFSGVYRVYRITSTFSSNLFKQEIEMFRRLNQDSATIDNCLSALNAQATGSTPFLRPATSGVNAGDINLFLRQAEETELMFNIFGQLRLQDLTAAFNITPFGLISQLNNFTQLFDQARQIRSAIGNLGNLASNINLSNVNSQTIRQLTNELSEAQDYFNQAFTQVDVSSITQALNQDLSNLGSQFQGAIGQFQGAVSQVQQDFERIFTQTGRGTVPIPQPINAAPQGLQSALRPVARPPNLNPTLTRLIDTPDGPRRVVVGAGGRNFRPLARPGQNVSGEAARAIRIDQGSGGFGATGGTLT